MRVPLRQKQFPVGHEMHSLMTELFPFNRSITGDGVRKTLTRLQVLLPNLTIHEIPSGTRCFDWTVPEEWNIHDAYVKDSTGNHSIGELVSHLIFWNERILIAFHGDSPPNFNDDNEITFTKFGGKNWTASVQKLDSIQSQWEHAVENATDTQLHKWSSSIANICTHNAYHTGQIIYIRKQHGWWKSANGVK